MQEEWTLKSNWTIWTQLDHMDKIGQIRYYEQYGQNWTIWTKLDQTEKYGQNWTKLKNIDKIVSCFFTFVTVV